MKLRKTATLIQLGVPSDGAYKCRKCPTRDGWGVIVEHFYPGQSAPSRSYAYCPKCVAPQYACALRNISNGS